MVIIADMYQVIIKIVTTKGSKDSNPSVNWIHPDKDMEKFAELRNVELNNLVLLHEFDSHFNLIISKDSELAKNGSLSYRFNVGPMMKQNNDEEIEIEEELGKEETKETENNKSSN